MLEWDIPGARAQAHKYKRAKLGKSCFLLITTTYFGEKSCPVEVIVYYMRSLDFEVYRTLRQGNIRPGTEVQMYIAG